LGGRGFTYTGYFKLDIAFSVVKVEELGVNLFAELPL
jgi:hypothetical protein